MIKDKDQLVVAYKAPDELIGIAVKDILKQAGIESVLRTYQIPWYNGIMKTATGYWGEVIVKAEDKKEAEKIVKDFLESTEDK